MIPLFFAGSRTLVGPWIHFEKHCNILNVSSNSMTPGGKNMKLHTVELYETVVSICTVLLRFLWTNL